MYSHSCGHFEQGLVNVPFWGLWTSLSSICWRLYPHYLGDVQLGHVPTPLKGARWWEAMAFWGVQFSTYFLITEGKFAESEAAENLFQPLGQVGFPSNELSSILWPCRKGTGWWPICRGFSHCVSHAQIKSCFFSLLEDILKTYGSEISMLALLLGR